MIGSKRNSLVGWVLKTYARFITRRNFKAINFNEVAVASNRSVLLIANHFSAWDTIILDQVNQKLFRKKFHVMVLEDTLRKQPILKYAGAFSVDKSSRDMIASLDYAAQLLHDPQNLVLIYPQGKLYSNMVSEVIFESGVVRIMQHAGDKFQLLMAATFVENFEHFKATANVHIKAENAQNFSDIEQLQSAYQQHYAASRQQQINIIK